jgi:hypothetical protein
MAYTAIAKPSVHFNSGIFDGTGSSNAISGLGFQPDWVVGKSREAAYSWGCYDSTRGATKFLDCDTTGAEGTDAEGLKSFDSDGFTLGTSTSDPTFNASAKESYWWAFLGNGGTRVTFTESGANPGGGYQVNATAGFSIVDYTGTGSAGTVSHGLGVKPAWVLIKNRDSGVAWAAYYSDTGFITDPETDQMFFNATDNSVDDSTFFNDTAATTSVFSVGTATNTNTDSEKYIAYVFAEVQGFSHFGTYNGFEDKANGPTIYCGFRPRMVIVKRTDGNGPWGQQDVARTSRKKDGTAHFAYGNPVEQALYMDSGNAEHTGAFDTDFLATGFKCRTTDGTHNWTNYKYIYAAFADHPTVGTNGTIALAR